MPDDNTALLRRLVGGYLDAPAEVLERATDSTSPSASLLVAAALVATDPAFLERADELATTTRDRQLVALAGAHLRGDAGLLDVLVRDHLSEHPDNLLAAWIAGRPALDRPSKLATTEEENPMSELNTETPRSAVAVAALPRGGWRTTLRWLASFTGYPLGGFAALLLTGPVDNLGAALAGGLLTGAILGAVQSWALGEARPRPVAWILATAIGLMAGLGVGSAVVDYRTDLGSLVLQGAISGVVVGLAQSVVLLPRLGALALVWPVALSGIWAVAWAVTASLGIDVDEQFTIFGSSGALVAALLTAVLPLVLDRTRRTETSAS